jgi:uncharacterized surface protein with fasciclin (FAS1) repeats
MLALASMFPLFADARGDRSGRADVIERLCERQLWLGDRIKKPIIDPDICNPPPPPKEPMLVFAANPTTIVSGQSAELYWDSTDATGCNASNGWSGAKTPDGSQSVSPTVTTTYALECTGAGGSVTKSVTVTVTPALSQPTITLVKTVINNDGGTADADDFQAKIDDENVAWGVPLTVAAGAHTASETISAGYSAGTWGGDCAADGSITVALGESKTCTITYDDQPGTLRVKKVLVNDSGGTTAVSEFSFQVNGGVATAFEADGQNDVSVSAGTYSVTEVAAPGYTTTYSNCSNVAVANGETEICTIMNDDIAPEPELDTITELVVADSRFDTLEAAVIAAGLADDLGGTGPFTVFAPTDDAFAALPDGTLDALLADIPALTDILLYHVVSGKKMAAEVVLADTLLTLLGKTVDISVNDQGVFVNDAKIILTDIEASNGVIHVIDAVLTPPEEVAGDLLITEVLYDVGVGQGTETAGASGANNNEWVEIYNDTGAEIDLSGYTISDAGASDALPGGTILGAGQYLIITATSTTANFWTFPEGTLVVVLGSAIGNGLSNAGDRVELRNSVAELVDAVSWGTDVSAFDPAAPDVPEGSSLTRTSLVDTDTAADWAANATPNPGA